MELLTLTAALVALGLLALRYGRDSRDWRPDQGLAGWAVDRPRRAREVAMLEVVYPELALDRARALRQEAALARLVPPRAPRRLPRKVAFWSGLALVRCCRVLLALAAPPPNVALD